MIEELNNSVKFGCSGKNLSGSSLVYFVLHFNLIFNFNFEERALFFDALIDVRKIAFFSNIKQILITEYYSMLTSGHIDEISYFIICTDIETNILSSNHS